MTIFIDPLEQILIDFYLECWTANEEGKTTIVDYSVWADKIRNLFDCACGEPRNDKFIHSRYACQEIRKGGIGVLRA